MLLTPVYEFVSSQSTWVVLVCYNRVIHNGIKENTHVLGGRVLPIEHDVLLAVDDGGQEILVGEAEVARVVVDGHVHAVCAHLLRVLEGACDAGRGVGVAAAEREGVNGVRDSAGGVRGEEGGR